MQLHAKWPISDVIASTLLLLHRHEVLYCCFLANADVSSIGSTGVKSSSCRKRSLATHCSRALAVLAVALIHPRVVDSLVAGDAK